MRKATLSLALFFALAVSTQAQQTVYSHYSQPWNSFYVVPCANGGAGETITFSGTTQTTLREQTFTNGSIVAQWDQTDLAPVWFTLTGVGTTGIHYEIVFSDTFTAKLSPAKVQTGVYVQNWTANTGADYEHGGGGHSYQFHEDYKYTRTADDVFTYSDVHFFWLCK
jgi:hypothetical protein